MSDLERPIEADALSPFVVLDPHRMSPVLRLALVLVGVPLLGIATLLAWPPAPVGRAGALGGWLLGVAGVLLVGSAARGRRPGWLAVAEPVVWPEAVGSAALGLLFAARRDMAPVVTARTGLSLGAAQWLIGAAAVALLAGLVARRSVVGLPRVRERAVASPPWRPPEA